MFINGVLRKNKKLLIYFFWVSFSYILYLIHQRITHVVFIKFAAYTILCIISFQYQLIYNVKTDHFWHGRASRICCNPADWQISRAVLLVGLATRSNIQHTYFWKWRKTGRPTGNTVYTSRQRRPHHSGAARQCNGGRIGGAAAALIYGHFRVPHFTHKLK